MRRKAYALCLLFGFSLFLRTTPVVAVDPFLDWKTISSPHFNIHFPAGTESLAYQVLDIAEQVHARLSRQLQWVPRSPTEIVLTDEVDFPNGYSTPLPFNHIQLYASPPDEPIAFGGFRNWYELLITHEYTHLLHIDKAYGAPAVFRNILGRNLFSFPNLFQPLWMVEGLAVHNESNLEPGVGRGQSSRYAMMMRTEVRGGVRPFDQVSMSGLAEWPLGEIPYLYGGHFFQFLHERYGESRIKQLINGYSDNIIPFLIHSNFRRTLFKDSPTLWSEFSDHLEAHYAGELETIRAAGVVEGDRLTEHGFWTGQAQGLPDGSVYYIRDDGLSRPALMHLSPAEGDRTVAEVRHMARFDWHPEAGLVVAQPEVFDDHNIYFDLYHVDPKSGATSRLTRGRRYHFAAWDPSGERLAAVQNRLGRSRLVLLESGGSELETLWEGDGEAIISQLDWSPDGGQIVASVWRQSRGWELELFDVAGRQWRRLTHSLAIEGQPQFTSDGSILFTADDGGVFNVRRLDLPAAETTTLTNVETGAFSPTQAGDAVVYVGYHAEGYDLYRLERPAPAIPPVLPRNEPRALPPMESTAVPPRLPPRPYAPWRSLLPTTWAPSLHITNQVAEVGAATWGRDALGVHQYSAGIQREFNFGLTGGQFSYVFNNRVALLAARRHLYDYDEEGVLERIRRETQWEANAVLPFLSLDSSLAFWMGASGVVDSEVHREPGFAALGESRETVAGFAATFANARQHSRAFSRSDGRDLRLIAESSDAFESDYSGQIYTLDWREFIELPARNVLALRLAEGWGTEAPRPFELGGSGAASEGGFLFNVRNYPLRGYPLGLDALTGRRFQLGSLEWRFPVHDVNRSFLRFPFGLHGLHGSLFADAGAAWEEGSAPDEYRTGAGAELTGDVNLLYLFNLRLRFGMAKGLDEGGESQIYLTLGSAF